MSISLKKIKRWILMLSGKSIHHVNQGIGRYFSLNEIKGYYNDLSEKVTKYDDCFYYNYVPVERTIDGKIIEFPIGIFQFGLGAYDLFLANNNDIDLEKFKSCVEWALNSQNKDGSWNNFSFIYPDSPYSAMAQGEGTSLLIRAYVLFKDSKYLESAKKAINFMLRDVKEGGTAKKERDSLILLEFTNKAPVLNGWIFALWGLYDYCLVENDDYVKKALELTIKTLVEYLPHFKNKYWSKYNSEKSIASPFYHSLHIAQMEIMYNITNKQIFKDYAKKWKKQSKNVFCIFYAFIIKAIQKIKEEE